MGPRSIELAFYWKRCSDAFTSAAISRGGDLDGPGSWTAPGSVVSVLTAGGVVSVNAYGRPGCPIVVVGPIRTTLEGKACRGVDVPGP